VIFTGVLIGAKNELFFRRGLDTPNQLEFVQKIKVYVKSNFMPAGSMRTAIAAPDLTRRANQCPTARCCRSVIESAG
jgi:hypothetical protein